MHRWWDLTKIVALTIAIIVLARMVVRLEHVIGLVLLAGAAALLTAPLRKLLMRAMGPGTATALTAVVTFAGLVAIGAIVFHDLQAQADQLSGELTQRLQALEPGSRSARVAEAIEAEDGIRRSLRELPSIIVVGEPDAMGAGRQTLDMLLVVILAAFFQSAAGDAVGWFAARWPREQRKDVRSLLDDLDRRGVGYVRRTVALAGATALAVGLVTWACGVPGPALVGVWIGLCSLVPGIGWLLALAPVLTVRIIAPSGSATLVLFVAIVAIAAATWARRRFIEPRTTRPGVVLSAIAVAVGIDIAGFAGALATLTGLGIIVALLTTTCPIPRLPTALEPTGVPGERERDAGVTRWSWPGQIDNWRSALTLAIAAIGGVLAWTLLGHFGHAGVWLVVAGMLAIALNRPVAFLTRRRVPRALAVAIVFASAIAIGAIAGVAGVRGGVSTTAKLSEELPQAVTDLEDAPLVGGWLREQDASRWVDEQLADLPQRIEDGRGVDEYLPMLGNRLLDLFWVLLLAIALLLDGPRLFAAAERRVAVRRRRQFVRVIDAAHRAVGGYLAGAALVAALNATVVFFIALALGITLAPVLAVWAFLWNFVPQVGGFMGGFPLVVLALSVGPAQAVVAALLFIAYQFTENHLIQPAVISEAIDVPPWATLLTALSGGAAAGLLGAVVLTPLVGVVRVVMLETRRSDFPGRTAETTAARGAVLDDPG